MDGVLNHNGPLQPVPVANKANRMNNSSIAGGIFGEGASAAPADCKVHRTNQSSVEGGIFCADPMVRQSRPTLTPRGTVGTEIFGGQNAGWASADAPKPRLDPTKCEAAGAKRADESVAVERPMSARSDPNRSSIDGGIFGHAGSSRGQSGGRADPNRSSVPGGIFG